MTTVSESNEKLDNPVWHSLSETHFNFAIEYDDVKFYQPHYCPFGGFVNIKNTASAISKYVTLEDNFYVVGNKPHVDNGLKLNKELVCNQMVLESAIDIEINEEITPLETDHQDALFTLVDLVQPGYFKKRTSALGSYFGIFQNQQLVAVTGERMKMHLYTEVSAVVTHPQHQGKGYAKMLVAHTANKIIHENKMPYLHVAETNIRAIRLYEKLGFRTRRKISFWNLVKHDDENQR